MLRFLSLLILATGSSVMAAPPVPLTEVEWEARENQLKDSVSPEIVRPLSMAESKARQDKMAAFSTKAVDQNCEQVLVQRALKQVRTEQEVQSFLQSHPDFSTRAQVAPQKPDLVSEKGNSSKITTEDEDAMRVTSDDGVYFDVEQGLLVYLKNVRVSDPRFSLSCDNQLKLYFSREEGNKGKEKLVSEDEPMVTMPDVTKMNFSGIDYLSATGNVCITYQLKQGEGRVYGESVTYNGKTGELIVAGGERPRVVIGDNMISTSGADSFIRVYKNGSIYVKGKQVVTKLKNDKQLSLPGSKKK